MRLHREEKINRIIQRQKEMLASGEKNGSVIKKSMQRMAVQSLIIFFYTDVCMHSYIPCFPFHHNSKRFRIDPCKRDAYGKGFRGGEDPGGSRQKH